jgi:hypothetical protein
MNKYFIGFLLAILMLVPVALSQTISSDKQVKLETNRPAVYVTFECFGTREPRSEGESNKGIWLRMHNNLRWDLKVPGYDLSSPSFGTDQTSAIKNQDDQVVLYYDVEETRMRRGAMLFREVPEKPDAKHPGKAPRIPTPSAGYRATDIVHTVRLSSGGSVLFSIPAEHLTKHLAVSFSFDFEWEDSMDQTTHRVYFYGSDLPVGNPQQCSQTGH